MTHSQFQRKVRSWFRRHGRPYLPWRRTENPYRILVSEIMLQQTQVARVEKKYPEFIAAFPDFRALAVSPLRRVLEVWNGMGYNRRALDLKRIAAAVIHDYRGRLPRDPELLQKLPGIGPASARAISVFAFGAPRVFIETNIRRVYLAAFFPRRARIPDTLVLRKIRATLPRRKVREWYWALMDYGALGFKGLSNPNRRSAHYTKQTPFAGSRRELRGRILADLLRRGPRNRKDLIEKSAVEDRKRMREAVTGLLADGLLGERHGRLVISRT